VLSRQWPGGRTCASCRDLLWRQLHTPTIQDIHRFDGFTKCSSVRGSPGGTRGCLTIWTGSCAARHSQSVAADQQSQCVTRGSLWGAFAATQSCSSGAADLASLADQERGTTPPARTLCHHLKIIIQQQHFLLNKQLWLIWLVCCSWPPLGLSLSASGRGGLQLLLLGLPLQQQLLLLLQPRWSRTQKTACMMTNTQHVKAADQESNSTGQRVLPHAGVARWARLSTIAVAPANPAATMYQTAGC
jgi:hypothetical protein